MAHGLEAGLLQLSVAGRVAAEWHKGWKRVCNSFLLPVEWWLIGTRVGSGFTLLSRLHSASFPAVLIYR